MVEITKMVEITIYGKVVSLSKNLRGLLTYARNHTVVAVTITKLGVGGDLKVDFFNGARCATHFESYGVLVEWVRTRRALQGATLYDGMTWEGAVSRKNPWLLEHGYRANLSPNETR